MITMKCPNCGRTYNQSDECANLLIPCMNCRYPLKKIEDVKNVRNPKLNEHNIIGTVADPTKPTIKCPTCGSTQVKRISTTAKVVGATMFGLFSKTARSQFECLDCKYKW